MKSVLFILLFVATVFGRKGFGPTEQEWGFVDVRKGAQIFWWLQQTSADVKNYTERPLVIWLQGGPGGSSTGFGNIGELGPWDVDLKERSTSWLKNYNLLFVDNPVGTGFSNVQASAGGLYATTNRQIADDFLVVLKEFYKSVPELRKTPLYIFCESYGGKMTAEIALVLYRAIESEGLDINFKGVGLGDSWISPIDSVLTWGPYLLNLGAIDQKQYENIQTFAIQAKEAIDAKQYSIAYNLWTLIETIILDVTDGISFYNVLEKIPSRMLKTRNFETSLYYPGQEIDDATIDSLMNNQVRKALGISNITWGRQSGAVFSHLSADFMKPVTSIVEELLDTTDLTVAVYNGQLDLIVDTPGTIKWVDELQFKGSEAWKKASRLTFSVNGIIEGYYKKTGKLAMYWINRSGHMVPIDNPAAMDYILKDVISE